MRLFLKAIINFHCYKIKQNNTWFKAELPTLPYMGIWNAKDADFVCIEPWCGIADHVNASGVISEKEGINKLQPEHVFNRIWTVDLFKLS